MALLLRERVINDFAYHAPNDEQAVRHAAVRALCEELALQLLDLTPMSREQSLALTNLEQVMFWSNAAIARNK